MLTRLQHAATNMIWRAVDEIRQHPDRGDESVSKILWAGVIVAVVAVVGGIFRDTIVAAFNALVITLGFTP